MLHIEDKLQELYFQSLALHCLKIQANLDKTTIMNEMSIKENDFDLLERILNAITLPNDILLNGF